MTLDEDVTKFLYLETSTTKNILYCRLEDETRKKLLELPLFLSPSLSHDIHDFREFGEDVRGRESRLGRDIS